MDRRQYYLTLGRYIGGFILSVVITLGAYALGTGNTLMGIGLMIVLGVLAVAQIFVQLIFFVRIQHERGPRIKLFSFGFMAVVLLILITGSVWIMYHLNYNMMHMTPDDMNSYMRAKSGGGGF